MTPHTVLWHEDMDGYDDATFSWDQLVRMEVRRPQGGRGGMPVIYFLWGQRHYAYAQYPNRTNRKADRK